MANYPFIDKLTTDELMQLQQMVILNPDFISERISERNDKVNMLYSSTSSYPVKEVITSTDEVNYKTLEVLSNIKISELDFLEASFTEVGNNKIRFHIPFDFILYNEEGYSIAKNYGIHDRMSYYNLQKNTKDSFMNTDKVKDILEKSACVSYLEEFFKNPDTIKALPGALNTYNYIKKYLFEVVDGNNSDSIEIYNNILKEQDSKVKLVTENFQAIANELLFARESISSKKSPRLSVSNQGLKYYAQNPCNNPSGKQKLLINAIAFGTSLEDLENQDYSNAKRLIFTKK